MSRYNSKPISQFPTGSEVKSTDYYLATDTTDNTDSPVGTTKKYTINKLQEFLADGFHGNEIQTAYVSSTANLNAVYVNGDDGVGATLTNNGALSALILDGVATTVGMRVLISYQTNAEENGVYVVSEIGGVSDPWVLTRATDFDGSALGEINQGDFIGVLFGTLNALSWWFLTSETPSDVGVDPIVFSKQQNVVSDNWQSASVDPTAMAVNTGYTANIGASDIVLSLPVFAPEGSYVKAVNYNSTKMAISQNAGQQILIGTDSTTIGVGGYVETVDKGSFIVLRCIVANTVFAAESFVGSFNSF